MFSWLAHWLGLDNASGSPYLFWSGFFADVPIILAAYFVARKHNCHEPWCWRVGKFQVEGTDWHKCRRHHPHDNPGK